MAHYILQVIFFQLGFLLIYEILLKKETFFNYNRIYLLFTPVIALILPFLNFEIFENVVPTEAFVMLPEIIIGNGAEVATTTVESFSEKISSINWWFIAYGFGVILSSFLFLKKYLALRNLYRFRIISAEKQWKIIEVPHSKIACTFFDTIFIGDQISEGEKQQILYHEFVHVKQKHSLDLLFFEIQKIIFWFNPMVYVYQNKISSLHEFIADSQAIKSTEKTTYYQQLLNSAFGTENISFINQFFNHSLIKKRIVMLQKSKSKSVAKFKYLLIIPLMLAMLVYVSCSNENEAPTVNISEIDSTDQELKESLWKELKEMEANGADFREISKTFVVEGKAANWSRENFYRYTTFIRWVKEESNEGGDKGNKTLDNIINMNYEQYLANKNNGLAPPPPPPPFPTNPLDENVPFTVIENVPVYPGCENLTSNEERKTCMSEKITEFVGANFNSKGVKEFSQKGMNKVYVTFKIDSTGNVVDIKSRGPHPKLEAEAERVIAMLPKMVPGEHGGKKVGVMYSLPIIFMVD